VGEVVELRTRHAIGLPDGPQQDMPLPNILVLEAQSSGAAILFRFTASGEDCGDTWHNDVESAKEQAAWEHEGILGMWAKAPAECPDLASALHYGQRLCKVGISALTYNVRRTGRAICGARCALIL